jgi:hypothetical protein
VPLGRNRARPRCTVRSAAHVRGSGGPARPARATHDASARRQRCSVSRRRHGAGARETAGNGGSPAQRRWHGVTKTGERRARQSGQHSGGPSDDAVGEASYRKASGASEAVGRSVTRSEGGWRGRGGAVSDGTEGGARDRWVPLSAISE